MNLKSLLLGSAAAMLAGTSSFAADAVVAEPEAVEYVRVCDAYGAGYFYIPGTERCMQLSGEVRFEYLILDSDLGTADDVDTDWRYRARFQIRTANEPDFGTIRTRIRLESSSVDPVQQQVSLQALQLSIGGLEVGFFDNFWTTNTGYGNLFAANDGYYGYDQALYAQYTFEVAGFGVTAGVEQTIPDGGLGNNPDFSGEELNLYAGANYGGSWGNVAGTIYYDNFQDEIDYKVSLELRPIEGLRVKGWFLGGDGIYSSQATGDTIFGGVAIDGDYAYGLSASYTINDFTPYLGYSDTDSDAAPATLVAGVVWSPSSTDGLQVQLEGNFALEDQGIISDAEPQLYRMRLIKSF